MMMLFVLIMLAVLGMAGLKLLPVYLESFKVQMDENGIVMRGANTLLSQGVGVRSADAVEARLLMMAAVDHGLGTIKDVLDSTTGQILRGELVEAARKEEMEYFHRLGYTTK